MTLNGDPGFNISGTDHQDSPNMKTKIICFVYFDFKSLSDHFHILHVVERIALYIGVKSILKSFIFEIYFVADAPMCALCKLTYVPKPKHRLSLDPRCRLTLEPRCISILESSLRSTLEPNEPRCRLTLEPR